MTPPLKNDTNESNAVASSFVNNAASFTNQSVNYAASTTIAAVSNDKDCHQTEKNAVTSYQELLILDGENIKSLGEEFANLDLTIGLQMKNGQ